MVTLQATTDEQEFNVCPRNYERIYDVSLTIREEATGLTETVTVSAFDEDNDWICVAATFSFLKEGYTYYLTITSDDEVWFRSKAIVVAAVDTTQKHSLSTGGDDGLNSINRTEGFKILPQ